jgi:hypothetical protein
MQWLSRLLRPLGVAGEGLLDRVLCVVGAVAFSQVPEFIQQYLQRLGGRLDEARRQLDQFRTAAEQSGLTLGQLTARAAADPDPAIGRLGSLAGQAAERVDSLAAAEAAIRHASIFARPFVFIRHLDPEIARATAAIFRPAVPTTAEGLVYALVGIAVALGAYHFGVKVAVGRAWRARAARRAGLTPGTPRI